MAICANNRRLRSARRLADHHHGGAQQAAVEQVALLEHVDHAVRLDIGAFLHGHRLVVFGVERLTVRIDGFKVVALEGVLEHLQGQLDTFTDLLDVLVFSAGVRQGQLQAVDHRQQVGGEFLQGELVRLLDVLLGTATDVLQVGGSAQGLVLGGGQLLFELQNARVGGCCTGFFGIQVLLIQLFVSHWVSPPRFLSCEPGSPCLAGYMGSEKPGSRGQVLFHIRRPAIGRLAKSTV